MNFFVTGVFVITHISSCRNGAGYCILGFSCEVDKDFVKDDLGGHCTGLGEAFNPRASFVCCRENPALHPPKEIPSMKEEDEEEVQVQEIVIENTNLITETSVVTEMVTEVVTEVETVTDIVTNVVTEMVTEEVMVPGTVEDLEKEQQPKEQPEVNCFAAILLGINCDSEKSPQKAQRLDDEGQYVLISSSNVEADPGEFKELPKETSTTEGETTQVTAALQLMVDGPKGKTFWARANRKTRKWTLSYRKLDFKKLKFKSSSEYL